MGRRRPAQLLRRCPPTRSRLDRALALSGQIAFRSLGAPLARRRTSRRLLNRAHAGRQPNHRRNHLLRLLLLFPSRQPQDQYSLLLYQSGITKPIARSSLIACWFGMAAKRSPVGVKPRNVHTTVVGKFAKGFRAKKSILTCCWYVSTQPQGHLAGLISSASVLQGVNFGAMAYR